MSLCTRLAILLPVALGAAVGTALATGAGIYVGREFVEQFTEGFDHPEAVRSFANLEFSAGRAELLPGGELAYDFVYAPVDGPYGPVEPRMGSFWIEYDDNASPGSQLSIVMTAEPLPEFPDQGTVTLTLSLDTESVIVTRDIENDGVASASVARVPGRAWFGFERSVVGWAPVLEDASGLHVFDALSYVPVRPVGLEVQGEGLALETILLETYAFVSGSGSSVSELKARYRSSR